MHVGFTGTRSGMSDSQLDQLYDILYGLKTPVILHHGDCMGADQQMHVMAAELFPDMQLHVHPPINDYLRAYCQGHVTYQPEDYLSRDQKIVDVSDLLIAAPLTDYFVPRSGTWYTVRYAQNKLKSVYILKR